MHEFFEHTADLGIRLHSVSLEQLLAEAGTALFELIVEDISTVRPTHSHTIIVRQTDPALLLFDWLIELLYRFEAQSWLYSRFETTCTESGLAAVVSGEPRHADRHPLSHEVKAITYHELKVVRRSDGGWFAEVIVDI